MRIEKLEVSGLRSHRGDPPTVLEFDGKSLVAIVGPTGAGKSSLLEAICFALYGEATYGGKAYKELSSDGCTQISVRMVFTVGTDRYQLVRSVAPNRNGVFGAKETWLRQVDNDGTPLMHVDQVRKVDAAIRNLLGGMDRVQFCQAVLLAQNRFAELLETDERKRLELLDILLGLTALADARKALHTTEKAVQRNFERLEDRRTRLPKDPAAFAKEAAKRSKAMADLAKRARSGADKLKVLAEESRRLTDEATTLEEAAALRVAGADGHMRLAELVVSLEGLVSEDKRIAHEMSGAQTTKNRAESELEETAGALEKVEQEHGKAGTHGVIAQQLLQLAGHFAERPRHARSLTEAGEELDRITNDLVGAQTTATETGAALAKAQEGERQAKDRARKIEEGLDARQQDLTAADELVGRLSTDADEVRKTLSALAIADQERARRKEACEAAESNWEGADAVLRAAQQASHAAAAAHDCSPGDPCPVCHRELPAEWSPPQSANLEEAAAAQSRANKALQKATNAHASASQQHARAAAGFAGATIAFAGEGANLTRLCQKRDLPPPPTFAAPELADDVPLDQARTAAEQVQSLKPELEQWRSQLDGILAPLQNALTGANADAKSAEAKRTAADVAVTAATEQLAQLRAKSAGAEERQRGAKIALSDTEHRIEILHSKLPDRWGTLVAPGAKNPVQAADQALAADKAEVDRATNALDEAAKALRQAKERIASLETEKARVVDTPIAASKTSLANLSAMVTSLATKVQLERAAVPETAQAEELLHAAQSTRALAAQAATAANTRAASLRENAASRVQPARTAVEELLALKHDADPEGLRIAATPDPDRPLQPNTLEAVQQLVGAANTAATTAKDEADQAKEDVETVKGLDKRLRDLATWRANLAGALEVLKKDNFPSWARDQRIAELVDTASELLSQMTGGRYRYDSHLRIADEVAGIVRSASTLSGGEKFEAALALALGVAEIAGRSGIRFDTLFLDEGFAGLDQANLNRALDALETEVEAGRCIVLITHIGAVADRIKDVLYVESDGMGGSTTRWLAEDERYELGADLDMAVN